MTITDSADEPSAVPRTAAELIARADLESASRAIQGATVRTPTLVCADLAELAGTPVALKAECLQVTGSFKLRGALSKVAALGQHVAPGLVTASAGNHARAVAQAARVTGVSCEVFMPRDASVSKVAAVERLGASVELDGASVDEALGLARARAASTGAALVHPFDDLDVIAGQGTLALELLEDVPDLARVVVPVGGGGLASGIGIALRRAGAQVELVGVQAHMCAPYVQALSGASAASGPARPSAATIADAADARDARPRSH
jgi:threonine dehydratase